MLIAICDDERIIREEIKKQLSEIELECEVYEYSNGKELVDAEWVYDLIFLDIEMPEMDGMRTAECLREMGNSSRIIFLTSHTEFMPDAFKVKAFRFLNKPIDEDDFAEAVNEAYKEVQEQEVIEVSEENKTSMVLLSDVVCFEACGDRTFIYVQNDVLISNKGLRYWCEQIEGKPFFQVHKSYIVALRYVKIIESSQVVVQNMKQSVPISRRKMTRFKNVYKEYIRNNARYV